MSKTVLLELTEREVEIVQNLVAQFKVEPKKEVTEDYTDYTNRVKRCQSILDKSEKALQPKEEHLITENDLFNILSLAKDQYLNLPLEPYLSYKKVEEKDFKHIALAQSLIGWFNSKDMLKNTARFDLTDHSYQFEELD